MTMIFKSIKALKHINSKELLKIPFRIGNKSIIEISKNAKIIFTNKGSRLYINKSWTRKNPFYSHLTMGENAKIIVNGVFSFYPDTKIGIHSNAVLEIGNGYINSNATITVRKNIKIGNNVIIGPNCTIRDTDDHLIDSNTEICKEIEIQDNVWIGTNVIILKGVTIGEGSMVAAGSLVNKSIPIKSLVGGVPARIIRRNISWH